MISREGGGHKLYRRATSNQSNQEESYEFLLKCEKLWNLENHYTYCQFGYQFVTSLPHYLSIALYIFIPLISLLSPKT